MANLTLPDFPAEMRLNGRLFFRRHDLERYKWAIMVAAGLVKPGEAMPDLGRDELVNSGDAARELGIGRRTLGRRLVAKKSEAA